MNAELLVPIIASLGWLALCGAALASYRLRLDQLVRLGLVWLAIFAGLYALVAWAMMAGASASGAA
jgi:hypothetical protein